MADTSRMAGIKGSRSFHRRIEIGWVKNEPRGHTNLCRILSDPNVVRAAYKRPRSTAVLVYQGDVACNVVSNKRGSWLAPCAHEKKDRIGFRKAKRAARNNIGIPEVCT